MPLTKTACACASDVSCPHPVQDIVAGKAMDMERAIDDLLGSYSKRLLHNFLLSDVVGLTRLEEEAAEIHLQSHSPAKRERPKTAGASRPSSTLPAASSHPKVKKISDDSHLLQSPHGRPNVTHFTPKDRVMDEYDNNQRHHRLPNEDNMVFPVGVATSLKEVQLTDDERVSSVHVNRLKMAILLANKAYEKKNIEDKNGKNQPDKAVLRSQSAKGKRPQQPPSGQPNMTRQATAPGAVYGPDDDALLVLEAEAMAEGAALNHIEKTHKKKVSGSAAEKSPVQEKKEGDFSSGVNMDGLLIPFASIILGSNAGERSSQDQKSRAPINIGSIVRKKLGGEESNTPQSVPISSKPASKPWVLPDPREASMSSLPANTAIRISLYRLADILIQKVLPWQAVCCPLAIESLRFARLRGVLNKQQEILDVKMHQLETLVEESLKYNDNEMTKWAEAEEARRFNAFRTIEQKVVAFIGSEKTRLEEVHKRREQQRISRSHDDVSTLMEGERFSSDNMSVSFESKCIAVRRFVDEGSLRKDVIDLISTMDYLQNEQIQLDKDREDHLRQRNGPTDTATLIGSKLHLPVPADAICSEQTAVISYGDDSSLSALIAQSNQATSSILRVNRKIQEARLKADEAFEFLSTLADNALTLEIAKGAMEDIKKDMKAFNKKFSRIQEVATERFHDRGRSVYEALDAAQNQMNQISSDLVTRERLVGRAVTMYLAKVLASEPHALRSPFLQAEMVWDHKYMVDKASAAERFTKKRFDDMLAHFADGVKLLRQRARERNEAIQRALSAISFEHTKTVYEKESDYDMLFKRHVSNITSIRRAGEKQLRLYRRGMFQFEDRFSNEVLNLHSRMWSAVNAQWEKERAIERLITDNNLIRKSDQFEMFERRWERSTAKVREWIQQQQTMFTSGASNAAMVSRMDTVGDVLSAIAAHPAVFRPHLFESSRAHLFMVQTDWSGRLADLALVSCRKAAGTVKTGRATLMLSIAYGAAATNGLGNEVSCSETKYRPSDSLQLGDEFRITRLQSTLEDLKNEIIVPLLANVSLRLKDELHHMRTHVIDPQLSCLKRYWGAELSRGNEELSDYINALRKAEAEMLYSLWILSVEEEAECSCYEQASIARFRFFLDDWRAQTEQLCLAMMGIQEDVKYKTFDATAAAKTAKDRISKFVAESPVNVMTSYLDIAGDLHRKEYGRSGRGNTEVSNRPPFNPPVLVAFGRCAAPTVDPNGIMSSSNNMASLLPKSPGDSTRPTSAKKVPSKKHNKTKSNVANMEDRLTQLSSLDALATPASTRKISPPTSMRALEESILNEDALHVISVVLDMKPTVLKSFVLRVQSDFAALSNSYIPPTSNNEVEDSEQDFELQPDGEDARRHNGPEVNLMYGYHPLETLFSRLLLAAGALWQSCFSGEMKMVYSSGSADTVVPTEEQCKATFCLSASALFVHSTEHVRGYSDPSALVKNVRDSFYGVVASALLAVVILKRKTKSVFAEELLVAEDAWLRHRLDLPIPASHTSITTSSELVSRILDNAFKPKAGRGSEDEVNEGGHSKPEVISVHDFLQRTLHDGDSEVPLVDCTVIIAMLGTADGKLDFGASEVNALSAGLVAWRLASWAALYVQLLPIPAGMSKGIPTLTATLKLGRAGQRSAEMQMDTPSGAVMLSNKKDADDINAVECVSPVAVVSYLLQYLTGGLPLLPVSYLQAVCLAGVNNDLGDPWLCDATSLALAMESKRAIEDAKGDGKAKSRGGIFLRESAFILFMGRILTAEGAVKQTTSDASGGSERKLLFKPHFIPEMSGALHAYDIGNTKIVAAEVLRNFVSTEVIPTGHKGPGSFDASAASLAFYCMVRHTPDRSDSSIHASVQDKDGGVATSSTLALALEQTSALGDVMLALQEKIRPVTVMDPTATIGCLSVPMKSNDSLRMMAKAINFNRPLHPSHLSKKADTDEPNNDEEGAGLTSATMWLYNTAISFADVENMKIFSVVPMVESEELSAYLSKIRSASSSKETAVGNVTAAIELWALASYKQACDCHVSAQYRKSTEGIDMGLGSSSPSNGERSPRGAHFNRIQHVNSPKAQPDDIVAAQEEVNSLSQDKFALFWQQRCQQRIMHVQLMSSDLKCALMNNWSARIYFSRVMRFNSRAVVVRQSMDGIRRQYGDLLAAVLLRRGSKLALYNGEMDTYRAMHGSLEQLARGLISFYEKCFQTFFEGCQSAVYLIERTAIDFEALIATHRQLCLRRSAILSGSENEENPFADDDEGPRMIQYVFFDKVEQSSVMTRYYDAVGSVRGQLEKRYQACRDFVDGDMSGCDQLKQRTHVELSDIDKNISITVTMYLSLFVDAIVRAIENTQHAAGLSMDGVDGELEMELMLRGNEVSDGLRPLHQFVAVQDKIVETYLRKLFMASFQRNETLESVRLDSLEKLKSDWKVERMVLTSRVEAIQQSRIQHFSNAIIRARESFESYRSALTPYIDKFNRETIYRALMCDMYSLFCGLVPTGESPNGKVVTRTLSTLQKSNISDMRQLVDLGFVQIEEKLQGILLQLNSDMKTLSEIFDKQLSEELQSIQKLLWNNIGSEDNLSDTISYFPDGSQFPSYHDQRCEHTYSTIIQKEIANRRNIVSLLRQYLCSMWGDSESERGDDFMSILTRQKAKLRSECEETIADPSNHAKLKVASRLRDANPVQEAHEVLDFVITAALAISELTTEVKCTRDTVLQNVEQDEATTVKILEQMISAEKRKEVESYLTSLSSADSTVERAVAMFTLPHDNDFAETDIILGESSDAGGEDQLCLLTGPATLGISSIRCQLNEVKTAETGDVYSLEVSFCTFQIVLEQLEPGSTVWANLDICVDVTADEVCNKKLTATLKDVPMEGPARRMEASGYLHEVVVSPSSDMHSISMHRSDEALGSEVMIHIPLLNTEYVVVGTVVITTRLDVTFFPTQNSDFDSVTLGRLNQARKERFLNSCRRSQRVVRQVSAAVDAQRSLLEEKALQEERQKRVHEQNELAKRADMENAQTQMLEQQRMRLAEETKKIEEPPPTTDMPIKYEESSNIAVNNAELSSSDIPEPTEPPKVNHEESSERVPAATMVPSIPEHEELSLYTPSNLGGHSAPNTLLDINSLRPTELFLSPSSSPEGSKSFSNEALRKGSPLKPQSPMPRGHSRTITTGLSTVGDEGGSVITQPPPPRAPSLSVKAVDGVDRMARAVSKLSDVVPNSARSIAPGDADLDNLDWKQYFDEQSGQVYYYNEVTGESSWELNAYKKLPHGWREYYTDDGYPYYCNDETQETTWDYPIEKNESSRATATAVDYTLFSDGDEAAHSDNHGLHYDYTIDLFAGGNTSYLDTPSTKEIKIVRSDSLYMVTPSVQPLKPPERYGRDEPAAGKSDLLGSRDESPSTPKPLNRVPSGMLSSDSDLPPDNMAESPMLMNKSFRKSTNTTKKASMATLNGELQAILVDDFTEIADPFQSSLPLDASDSLVLFTQTAEQARVDVGRKMTSRWQLSLRKLNNSIEKAKGDHLEVSNDAYEDAYRRMDESVSSLIQELNSSIHTLIRSADTNFGVENDIRRQLQAVMNQEYMVGREERLATLLDEIDLHKEHISKSKKDDGAVVEVMKSRWLGLSIELSKYMGYAESTAAKGVAESVATAIQQLRNFEVHEKRCIKSAQRQELSLMRNECRDRIFGPEAEAGANDEDEPSRQMMAMAFHEPSVYSQKDAGLRSGVGSPDGSVFRRDSVDLKSLPSRSAFMMDEAALDGIWGQSKSSGMDINILITNEVKRTLHFMVSEVELEEKQYTFYKELYAEVVMKVKETNAEIESWSDGKDNGNSSIETGMYNPQIYRLALTRHADNVNSLLSKLTEKVRTNYELIEAAVQQLDEEAESIVEMTLEEH